MAKWTENFQISNPAKCANDLAMFHVKKHQITLIWNLWLFRILVLSQISQNILNCSKALLSLANTSSIMKLYCYKIRKELFYFVSDSSEVIDFLFFFHIHHPSSQIFRFQQFCLYFLTELMVYFLNMIWWFHFPEIFPDFPDFSGFPGFPGFSRISRIFPDFPDFFNFSQF